MLPHQRTTRSSMPWRLRLQGARLTYARRTTLCSHVPAALSAGAVRRRHAIRLAAVRTAPAWHIVHMVQSRNHRVSDLLLNFGAGLSHHGTRVLGFGTY